MARASQQASGLRELIQRDLGGDFGKSDAGENLLLQIGWYHDGRDWQHWGSGGIVYFILHADAIVAARFGDAEPEMQCT